MSEDNVLTCDGCHKPINDGDTYYEINWDGDCFIECEKCWLPVIEDLVT